MCAGAIDGTFMKIRKPETWEDSYWCYKNYSAIVLLAVVNAKDLFTYIDARRAGSLGDAFIWNNCSLKRALHDGQVLCGRSQIIQGAKAGYPLMVKLKKTHRQTQKMLRRMQQMLSGMLWHNTFLRNEI